MDYCMLLTEGERNRDVSMKLVTLICKLMWIVRGIVHYDNEGMLRVIIVFTSFY